MNWYKRRRMEWINECIEVYGFINRVHLVRKFGCSPQLATSDLTEFSKANPEKLKYCNRQKSYVSASPTPHGLGGV